MITAWAVPDVERADYRPARMRNSPGTHQRSIVHRGLRLCTALTIGNVLAAAVRLIVSNAGRSID